MGVDISVYRCRIGMFCMPIKCRNTWTGISVRGKTVSMTLRLAVLMLVLLTLGGDVEENPGPDKVNTRAVTSSRRQNVNTHHDSSPVITKSANVTATGTSMKKQTTLSYAQASASPRNIPHDVQDNSLHLRTQQQQHRTDLSRTKQSDSVVSQEAVSSPQRTQLEQRNNEQPPIGGRNTRQTRLNIGEKGEVSVSDSNNNLSDLILSLKHDMNSNMYSINNQLSTITTTMSNLTDKLTDVVNTCESLKQDNIKLHQTNTILQSKVDNLESSIDHLENQSRRSNLLFDGIEGSTHETWDTSESKIIDVLKYDLHLQDTDQIRIERAHRLRRKGNSEKPTIIVKFSSFKDKQMILIAAKESLSRESGITIKEDYSQRIRKHRYELGKRMIEARQNNQFATVSYDKLIIDGNVYKYNEKDDSVVLVSRSRNSKQAPRGDPHGNVYHSEPANQESDTILSAHINEDENPSTNHSRDHSPAQEREDSARAH